MSQLYRIPDGSFPMEQFAVDHPPLAAFIKLTFEFFERYGIKYKPLRIVEITTGGSPAWCNGHMRLPEGCDPTAVAHELGHGAHEAWRKTGRWGEHFACAIRWFVEEYANVRPCHHFECRRQTDSIFLLVSHYDLKRFLAILTMGEEEFVRLISL